MSDSRISARAAAALKAMAPIQRFLTESSWARRPAGGEVCDFAIGNPHEMPPPGFAEALQRQVAPRDPSWYGYKMNEAESRAAVAASLLSWRGISIAPEDIFLTNGATTGLAIALGTVVEPDDEVIFLSPPWFQYEGMILAAGGRAVKVGIDRKSFDLDLEAIAAAITSRTRAIIVNSPHNPTGKIYPPATLRALAQILTAAARKNGRPLYLISDEAYSRIIFDGRSYHSPTEHYPDSFLIYTLTKTLLTPGTRLGYIALPPAMPGREGLREAIVGYQMLNGWAFPDALTQHALPELLGISLDIDHLQHKRDRLAGALRDRGYELHTPEATFYLIPRSPLKDDAAFVELLAEHHIYCVPGSAMDLPGFFRISLSASEAMVERSLPGFAAAIARAKTAGG